MLDELKPFSEYLIYIETPRGSFVKRNEHGRVDFVSPVPCPFHYGHVTGFVGGDGDPLDALYFGNELKGPNQRALLVGVVRFVDNDIRDDKYIFSHSALTVLERKRIQRFFSFYAFSKNVLAKIRRHATLSHVEKVEFWSG